jgi:hypothetical protein
MKLSPGDPLDGPRVLVMVKSALTSPDPALRTATQYRVAFPVLVTACVVCAVAPLYHEPQWKVLYWVQSRLVGTSMGQFPR